MYEWHLSWYLHNQRSLELYESGYFHSIFPPVIECCVCIHSLANKSVAYSRVGICRFVEMRVMKTNNIVRPKKTRASVVQSFLLASFGKEQFLNATKVALQVFTFHVCWQVV